MRLSGAEGHQWSDITATQVLSACLHNRQVWQSNAGCTRPVQFLAAEDTKLSAVKSGARLFVLARFVFQIFLDVRSGAEGMQGHL